MPKKKVDPIADDVREKIPPEDTDLMTRQLALRYAGQGIILQQASEIETRFDIRRRFGIPSLDIACGGGLPPGLSQIDGPEGTGKTFLCICALAQAQQIYGEDFRGAMACLEYPLDKMYARACGFKVALSGYEIDVEQRRRKEMGEPLLTNSEVDELRSQIGKFYIARGQAEVVLDVLVEYVHSQQFQLIVIDSWDAMLTAPEEEKDLDEDAKVASASGVQTRWMNKVHNALMPRDYCPECRSSRVEFKRHKDSGKWHCGECGWIGVKPRREESETTMIGIRQVRSNMNRMGMRSREWKVGGAWALKHGKLIDIQLRPGTPIMDSSNKVKIAKEVNWELMKGKAGTHEGKKGMYKYYYDPPQVDYCTDMINWCKQANLIKFIKRRWELQHDGSLGNENPLVFGSAERLQRAVEETPELQRGLWKLMLNHAGLGHIRYT